MFKFNLGFINNENAAMLVIGATGCGKTHSLIVRFKKKIKFFYFSLNFRDNTMMACSQELLLICLIKPRITFG